MSGLKDAVKGGWHPKGKDGKKESWRAENKGINQVAGWVGMGKDTTSRSYDHVSRPLSTLKDPTTFGPPPKRVAASDAGGLGRALAQPEGPAEQKADAVEDGTDGEETAPGPYKADITGLATGHLPKPPARRLATDAGGTNAPNAPNASTDPPRRPNLPPRLPPRQNSNPAAPPYDITSRPTIEKDDSASLNQGALGRLGAAGISVPGFNIGKAASRSPTHSPSPASSGQKPQLNELQSRFSKLSTSPPGTGPPSEGTTLAQKQAALRTAESFRKDPSSVSLADARAAASTANNFRERHGEQVARGWKAADGLNKKYGIVDHANTITGNQPSAAAAPELPPNKPNIRTESLPSPTAPEISTIAGKKKPPPPPPKKRELGGNGAPPPPLPLASKPKPGYTASRQNDQE
ncbi:MAG: hypothetical protein M1839_004226 [Geoglossum umbratile]|nr:MAG: hypothetical protein M1839_004226 [Geoglossum umbratile]